MGGNILINVVVIEVEEKSRKYFPCVIRKVVARAFHPGNIPHTESSKHKTKQNSFMRWLRAHHQNREVKGLPYFFGKWSNLTRIKYILRKAEYKVKFSFGVKPLKT